MKTTSFNLQINKREFTISFNTKELQSFPKGIPFIAISNQIEKLNAPILSVLFQELGKKIPIYTSPTRSVLEGLIKEPPQQPLAIGIPFLPYTTTELRKGNTIRCIAKHLKIYEVPLVPIRLVLEDARTFQTAKLKQNIHKMPIRISLRIGKSIPVDAQASFEHIRQFRKFIQSKIYALGTNLEVKPSFFSPLKLRVTSASQVPLMSPVESSVIQTEIAQLTLKHRIAARANFDILVAAATEIPETLREIGRLRELTFREVGEGTGKALDLDEYDLYYKQLIIWDRDAQKIVGGYRMGEGDEIFRNYGVEGFYIHSLFQIKKGFYPIMQQSVELGRSYIVPAYQKHRLPLFLLWKGILFFLLRNPQYKYLYGPMSISKYYSEISKGLIVAFVKKYYFNDELAQYLKARNPFRFKSKKVDIDVLLENLDDKVRSLDSFVEDIEPNHFRIPVLLKQYIKLNARFISFNVDPNFSDVLDGFIILNLEDVPPATIEALQKEA